MGGWSTALIIVLSLLFVLLSGIPISFGLMGLSALLLLVFIGPTSMLIVVASCYKQISTEVFMAIPLFVLMAAVLRFSGIANSLYHTMHIWMGPVRGGLAIGTVFICAIIDALSGIGATATTTMGLVALPEMLQRGYNKRMVLGVITVGGALGSLIPPSVLMIIVGGYAQLSVGRLFLGGVLPGLLITVGYAMYIAIRCFVRPEFGPSLRKEEQGSWRQKVKHLNSVILPITLIFFIMGGIYGGIFTPTEAGGFGALASIIISIVYGKFTITNMKEAFLTTLRISSMIMWLVMGGGCYSALINITGTGRLVSDIIQGLPFGQSGLIVFMLTIPLLMGMVIDPVAISMICIPIFLPICHALGLNILWFMLLFIIAVVIGYITPPFGINIFYMKGVAPDGTTIVEIYKGVMPFVFVKLFCFGLCICFPVILTWLPSLLK